VEDMISALYCATVCSYAQGLALIKATSDAKKWSVSLSECARIWKGGCIIRSKLLEKIQAAFIKEPKLVNLMLDHDFSEDLNRKQFAWRRIVTLSVAYGVGCPALCSSLNYFDSYRRDRLPSNLIQAQRDFFGGHSYERTDREGVFHCMWNESHKEIGDVNERTKGNV